MKQTAVERFKGLAAEPRFQGPPIISSAEVAKIPYFGAFLREIREPVTSGGQEGEWFPILRWFGWAVVFGLTKQGTVLTLCQWKMGVNRATWELPPGGVKEVKPGMSDPQILELIQTGYLRETGYGGGSWKGLGHVVIESGKYRGEKPDDHGLLAHLFLATDLEQAAPARQLGPGDIMETVHVPLDEWWEVLNSGLFVETSAVACAYKALVALERFDLLRS